MGRMIIMAYAGGIVGYADGGLIKDCKFSGNIYSRTASKNGQSYAGGIVGQAEDTTITGCDVDVTVDAEHWAGGIVGGTEEYCRIEGNTHIQKKIAVKQKASSKTVKAKKTTKKKSRK